MKSLKALMVSCLFVFLPQSGLTQVSPNQHEMMRQYGLDCSQRYDGCGSGSNYNGTVIHIPNQVWINYHGALASDYRGNGGISEFARSERAARREALRKCGTRDCKVEAYTRNGCLAAAYDERTKISAVGAEGTKEAAEAEAMQICLSGGGSSTCQITYSHCNHPVRIR